MWTMRHGRLIGSDARVAQVDLEADGLGRHRPIDLGVVGDSATRPPRPSPSRCRGHEQPATATRRRDSDRARDPLARRAVRATWGGDGTIDPRTLTIALDDLLPAERVVAVDSGNFMGYPSMFLSVPDEYGFCFTQAFQSIGLGLATAIGAALAQPDRLPVAALGDGGALMAAAELDTVRRLGLPMVAIVYNDAAYGAEVHHFDRTASHWTRSRSRTPTSRPSESATASTEPPCATSMIWRRSAGGSTARATAVWSSTRRLPPPGAPGGWRRHSAAIDLYVVIGPLR